MKGAYILLIVIEKEVNIEIGALGTIRFEKGHYCYVGSAVGPGGIEARVGRHLKKGKKLKWHIDYLLEHEDIEEAYYSTELSEMEIVTIFQRNSTEFRGSAHPILLSKPTCLSAKRTNS